MSAKPIRLSVHKSNIERTRRKTVREDMRRAAVGMSNSGNIVAYALVAFSDDGRAFASWDTGGVIPMWAAPQTVAGVLRADMDESGIDDDFKKPILDRAWRGSK